MKFSSIPLQLQGILVLIALFSFAISYNNLHDMALEMGIPSYLAWFFPFCIDAFLLACSIFILYAEEKQISPIEAWAFLLVYTVLSIVFNVIHSPDVFWYQVGYSACPISLCISLHLFVKVIKHEMVHEVKVTVPVLTCEKKIEHVEERPVSEPLVEYKQAKKSERLEAVREYYQLNPRSTYVDATKATGISYKTLKAYKEEIDAEEMHV